MAMVKTEIDEAFSSTVIIIGYVMGGVLLPVTNLIYLVMSVLGKKISTVVPRWLIIANILFFLVFIYYIFYLNDPYYHKK